MNGPVQRFYSLDVLRGFAAISIVVWHWRHFFYAGIDPEAISADRLPFHGWLFLFYTNGGMAVDLFFSLSGFIFFWLYSSAVAERSMSARSFVLLRLSRLYPLHLATLAAVAAGQAYLLSTQGYQFIYKFNDAKHLVLSLLFASGWGLEDGYSF